MQNRSSQPGPPRADCARWGGSRGDHHLRKRDVSDAARARTTADGRRAGRAHRAPRSVGHARRRLAGPARRPRRGASPLRVSTYTDEIQIIGRPRGRLLGLYATRRSESGARPYRTLLRGIEPLDGSCECADSSGTRSGCASTWWLSWRTWSRSWAAARSSARQLPRQRCAGILSAR
jgi:hypothetical protein